MMDYNLCLNSKNGQFDMLLGADEILLCGWCLVPKEQWEVPIII